MLDELAGVAVICGTVPAAAASEIWLTIFVVSVVFLAVVNMRRHYRENHGCNEGVFAYSKRAMKEYVNGA